MPTVREKIMENIRVLREQAGVSQQELSRRCGFDDSYLGKIERGQSEPSMEVLLRVARELERSPRELLRRDIPQPGPSHKKETRPTRTMHPFDYLVRRMNRAVAIVSQEGVILDVNRAMEQHRDVESEQLDGELLWEIPIWDNRTEELQRLKELLGSVYDQHRSLLLKNKTHSPGGNTFRFIFAYIQDPRSKWSYAMFEILEPGPSAPSKIPVGELEIISEWF